jgi:hypothetical protein
MTRHPPHCEQSATGQHNGLQPTKILTSVQDLNPYVFKPLGSSSVIIYFDPDPSVNK